jgi:hypothetical protein
MGSRMAQIYSDLLPERADADQVVEFQVAGAAA